MHDVLCADWHFARANFLTLTIYPKTICSSCISSNKAPQLESMRQEFPYTLALLVAYSKLYI